MLHAVISASVTTDAFTLAIPTDKGFYTWMLLHAEACRQSSPYTEELLHIEAFLKMLSIFYAHTHTAAVFT